MEAHHSNGWTDPRLISALKVGVFGRRPNLLASHRKRLPHYCDVIYIINLHTRSSVSILAEFGVP